MKNLSHKTHRFAQGDMMNPDFNQWSVLSSSSGDGARGDQGGRRGPPPLLASIVLLAYIVVSGTAMPDPRISSHLRVAHTFGVVPTGHTLPFGAHSDPPSPPLARGSDPGPRELIRHL